MTETKKQNAKICFLATAAFSLVANAFAYFNLTPHHKCHAIPNAMLSRSRLLPNGGWKNDHQI